MARKTESLSDGVQNVLKWSAALPILMVWPFVSFMPVVGFLERGATTFDITINLLFFFTGFMGVATALLMARLFVPAQNRHMADAYRGKLGLKLAVYGAIWLTVYTLYEVLVG